MNGKHLEGIIALRGTENSDRKLDVLFIHGLGGDAYSTWSSSTAGKNLFWPNWLADDFKEIGVWTIGYGATPSRWIDDVMPMEDRALNLLNQLSLKNIGERPIVFITHSMRGLITKQILEQAHLHAKSEYKKIVENLRGIIFLAVPHNGSGWTDLLDAAHLIVRGNKLIEQLRKDEPGLRRLSNSFNQIVKQYDIKCCSFFETKEVRIKRRFIGTKGIKIVSESSARGDFPQETPVGLDDDHLSICKLDSRGDQLYGNVSKLIENCLPATAPPTVKPDNPDKIQVSKLPHTSGSLFGRESELALLDQAWHNSQCNILTLKAMGGTGKTALMKSWLDNLATDQFRGANAVYTWSFYSQGSADEFFDAALQWFGYHGDSLPSAHNKGLTLAELVNQQRTLLLLDGLEPLQYPEGGAMDGALRDEGLKTLFKQLAAQNRGLLLISSRQNVIELPDSLKPLVIAHELEPLSITAGTALFKAANIKGNDPEFADTVNEYHGHALSLNLLATYLSQYEDSDIRQRTNLNTLTDFPEETRDSRHAFKIMAAYEKQLQGTAELRILYMMGLFDRPVSKGAIQCLRKADIEHISDSAVNKKVFKAAIKRLRNQHLLNKENSEHVDPDKKGMLDSHPLAREYFGKQLEQRYPHASQQAHCALYEYYKALPDKQLPDTLNEMEPLFAAVAHGCKAGLHQKALHEVCWPRIRREADNYLCDKLGAFGADLSTVSHFFEQHWHIPAAGLTDDGKAAVLNWAAFNLRALGRLQEAVQPMQAGLEMRIEQKNWNEAATDAGNLSELQLTRGDVSMSDNSALKAAEQSVQLADESGDAFQRMGKRTALADAQCQAGELAAARASFAEAEKLQQERQPEYPQLYSLPGFQYCDLLLTAGEWREVQKRAKQSLYWWENVFTNAGLLDITLDQLSLGRASLQQAVAEAIPNGGAEDVGRVSDSVTRRSPGLAPEYIVLRCANTTYDITAMQSAKDWLNQAVDGLRKAGTEDHLPRGILARASYYRWCLAFAIQQDTDPTSTTALPSTQQDALQDLQEARDIAQRGGMRLFLTDYHLESARLALTVDQTVHKLSAREHLEKAKTLIEQCGYKRRLPEVEYLEGVIMTNGEPAAT